MDENDVTCAKFESFDIYNIDVSYLKALHDADSEVFYNVYMYASQSGHKRKPFLGLIVGISAHKYFIPFTSSKPKHIAMKDVDSGHFLIYEMVPPQQLPALSKDAIVRKEGNSYKHIIAMLDLRKMIPVPDGLYSRVQISAEKDPSYRATLETEYYFCRNIQDDIVARVEKIYSIQRATGNIYKFYCNYVLLEQICDNYVVSEDETE